MRSPRWKYELLDRQDRPIGELDNVTPGGTVEIRALSRLGASASLSLTDRGRHIDWLSDRLRVSYSDARGEWPIATLRFTSPVDQHTATSLGYQVELLSKTSILDTDRSPNVTVIPAGTPIIPTVVSMIQATGETRIAATPSDRVLVNDFVRPAGESRLTIINELLAAAGYWSLWCDGSGLYRIEPYVDPAARPIRHHFEHGKTLYLPDWEREQDHASVPNRIIVVGVERDDAPALIGTAENTNTASPYSWQSRGVWITPEPETGVEAADLNVLDQIAQRKLHEAMNPVAKLAVTHAVEQLDPNDLVRFTPGDTGTRLATILGMTYTLDTGALVRADWREVIPE